MKVSKTIGTGIILMGFLTAHINALGQETIFDLFRNEANLGDHYYEDKNYYGALSLYLSAAKKHPARSENYLRVARCYYSLKQYDRSIEYYNNYLSVKRTLPWTDLYNYAEAHAITSNYAKAIESYRKYLAKDPGDEMILKKIWRLNNIQYLYEDSAQYDVKLVGLNSEYGELCPSYYKDGIIFMSNRKEAEVVENVNAALDLPFYKVYYGRIAGTFNNAGNIRFHSPLLFDKAFISKYNAGPVAFYDNEKKMVFVSTGNMASANGTRTLQLFFAEKENGEWKVKDPFPYNSVQYSISDPTINQEGTILYFSSDMESGFGGRDIYESRLVKGKWTRPKNLGNTINTVRDEAFPFLHMDRTLYFASNGHPGMGGLDIFRSMIRGDDSFDDPQNLGFPINTNSDDFGLIVDAQDRHGFFSSNRKNGGYDDDLYAVDMDMQTFPIAISGKIKYKEITWADSMELQIMPNTKITLIDNIRNVVVHESVSDSFGNFNIVIPYYSKYQIRVKEEDDDEYVTALEIPKRRKESNVHEIVIVKDIFKKNGKG